MLTPPAQALDNLTRVADAALLNGTDRRIIDASIQALAAAIKPPAAPEATPAPTPPPA